VKWLVLCRTVVGGCWGAGAIIIYFALIAIWRHDLREIEILHAFMLLLFGTPAIIANS